MVLSNALLLPNALLPLHIFEPQYRAMLAHCLERDRLFCVALRRPEPAEAPRDFFQIAGLGLIRACVANEDGTSSLVLQGIARVELMELAQAEPFRMVRIREVPSQSSPPLETEALGLKLVEICGKLREEGHELPEKLLEKLPQVDDPDLLSNIVTQALVRDPLQQQRLLEQSVVSERLRVLIRYLQGGSAA